MTKLRPKIAQCEPGLTLTCPASKTGSRLALNGGGRIFPLPVLPFFPACFFVSSHLLRDSLCTALQTRRLWIWSTGLSALLTPSSPWEAGFGEPVCPEDVHGRIYEGCVGEWQIVSSGSFRGGHWRYLPFGTMITGILLIGLGFALGYRKIQKRNSCPKSHKLPVMIEAVGRAVSIETETINRIWILSRWSSRLCKWKLMLSETRMDRENSCEGMQLFAPKTKKSILSFLAPRTHRPRPRPCWITTLGRALQWDALATSPITDITPLPRSTAPDRFVPPGLLSGSATSAVINGAGPDGCLPELDMFPLLQVMCLWYMCFCAEVFFSVLTLYSSMEHSLGVTFFFSSLSSCNAVIFFNSLSSCPVYPRVCMLCMGRLMAYFTGTCD